MAQKGSGQADVLVYDTTLRDGAQGEGISLSVEDKVRIACRLDTFGVHYVEGGWPGSNPKDAAFFERFAGGEAVVQLRQARLVAFGSTRYKYRSCEEDANVQALLAAQTPVVTLVAKSWDMQVEVVLEASLDENIAMIRDTVAYFKERGREVMLDSEHFFDGYRENREYAMQTLRAAAEAGVDVLVLCDTNGGSQPWEIEEITREVVTAFPYQRIGIHCHNDMELAVANSISAIRGGATLVQGTVNGYGERTGNANLMSIIPNVQLKLGLRCMEDNIVQLTQVSNFVDEIANQPHVRSRPFVGSSAFAHKGGLHVAAVMKRQSTYEHIAPDQVGNARRILVSELSGRGNILTKAEEIGLDLGAGVSWKTESKKVLDRVKELESKGYTFEGAEASVELMMRRRNPSYRAPFELLDFTVITGNKVSKHSVDGILFGESNSQATIKMEIITDSPEEGSCEVSRCLEVGEGNGPVDALHAAVSKALRQYYPSITHVVLTDYKVRILDSESATAATTRVMTEFVDSETKERWTTVSAHPNIIVASVNALAEGFEFAMLRRAPDCLK